MRLLLCTYYVCIHVATRWGYEAIVMYVLCMYSCSHQVGL